MKLEVDFPVVTHGLAVRSRAKKPVVARRTLNVDVPEFSAADAPVALVTTRGWNADPRSGGKSYRGVNGQLFVRSRHVTIYEGRIPHRFGFSQGAQNYDIHGVLDSEISMLLATLKERHSTGIVNAVIPARLGELRLDYDAHRPNDAMELPKLEDLQLKEYDEEAVAEQVSKFERHLARFVMIDGEMQMSEREPIYVATVAGDHRQSSIYSASLPHGELPDDNVQVSGASLLFRADTSLEEITTEIHQLGAILGDMEPREVDATGRVHVYDDRYLSFDAEGANMRLVAGKALKGFIADAAGVLMPLDHKKLSKFLLSLPAADFLAYRELERAMSEDDQDAIADALPHFARFQPGTGTRGNHGRSAAVIERVLESWSNRPITAPSVDQKLAAPWI